MKKLLLFLMIALCIGIAGAEEMLYHFPRAGEEWGGWVEYWLRAIGNDDKLYYDDNKLFFSEIPLLFELQKKESSDAWTNYYVKVNINGKGLIAKSIFKGNNNKTEKFAFRDTDFTIRTNTMFSYYGGSTCISEDDVYPKGPKVLFIPGKDPSIGTLYNIGSCSISTVGVIYSVIPTNPSTPPYNFQINVRAYWEAIGGDKSVGNSYGATVIYDKVPPEFSSPIEFIPIDTTNYKTFPGNGIIYYNGEIDLKVEPTDPPSSTDPTLPPLPGSGVREYGYRIYPYDTDEPGATPNPEVNWTIIGSPLPTDDWELPPRQTAEGLYTIELKAIDNVGNATTDRVGEEEATPTPITYNFAIDRTAPSPITTPSAAWETSILRPTLEPYTPPATPEIASVTPQPTEIPVPLPGDSQVNESIECMIGSVKIENLKVSWPKSTSDPLWQDGVGEREGSGIKGYDIGLSEIPFPTPANVAEWYYPQPSTDEPAEYSIPFASYQILGGRRGQTLNVAVRALDNLDNTIEWDDTSINWLDLTIPAKPIEINDVLYAVPDPTPDGTPQYNVTLIFNTPVPETSPGPNIYMIPIEPDGSIHTSTPIPAPAPGLETYSFTLMGAEHAHKRYIFATAQEQGGFLEYGNFGKEANNAPLPNIPADFTVKLATGSGASYVNKQGYHLAPDVTPILEDHILYTNSQIEFSLANSNCTGGFATDIEGDRIWFELWEKDQSSSIGGAFTAGSINTEIVLPAPAPEYERIMELYVAAYEYAGNDPVSECVNTTHDVSGTAIGFKVGFDFTPPSGDFAICNRDDHDTQYNQWNPSNTTFVSLKIIANADVQSGCTSGLDSITAYNLTDTSFISGPYSYQDFDIAAHTDALADGQYIPICAELPCLHDWDLKSSHNIGGAQYCIVVLKLEDKAGNVTYVPQTIPFDISLPPAPESSSFAYSYGSGDTLGLSWEPAAEGDAHMPAYEVRSEGNIIARIDVDPSSSEDVEYELDVSGLPPDTPVPITVRSINAAETQSNPVEFNPYTKPSPGTLSAPEQSGHALSFPHTGGAAHSFVLELSNAANPAEPPTALTLTNGTFVAENLSPHGEYSYRLIAKSSYDPADESKWIVYPEGSLLSFTLNNNPPAIPGGFSITPVTWTGESPVFSWTGCSDPDGETCFYTLYVRNAAGGTYSEFLSGNDGADTGITPQGFTFEDGESYEYYLEIRDKFEGPGGEGVTLSDHYFVTIDAQPPEIGIADLPTGFTTNRESVTINVIDFASGVDSCSALISVDGANPYSVPVALSGGSGALQLPEGNLLVIVSAKDVAGNVATRAPFSLLADRTRPSLDATSIAINLDQGSGRYLSATRNVPIVASFKDERSGIRDFAYAFTPSQSAPVNPESWRTIQITQSEPSSPDSSTRTYQGSLDFSGIDGVSYYLHTRSRDWAGNLSNTITSAIPILLDTSPPTASLAATGYAVYGSNYYASSLEQIQAAASTEDVHSGSTLSFGIEKLHGTDPIQWRPTLEEARAAITPETGAAYRIAAKGTNGTGLYAQARGEAFVYDPTQPVDLQISFDSGRAYASGEQMRIAASASEPESTISGYTLSIGTIAGGSEISSQIAGNIDGRLAPDASAGNAFIFNLPEVTDGEYFITLEARNGAGLAASLSSSLLIDNTAERLLVWDKAPYQSGTNSLSCRWEYRGTRTVSAYRYRVLGPAGEMLPLRTTPLESVTESLALQSGSSYWFEVSAEFTTGEPTGYVRSAGVMIDATQPAFASEDGFAVPLAVTSRGLKVSWNASDSESGIARVEALVEKYDAEGGLTNVSEGWIDFPALTQAEEHPILTDSAGEPLQIATGDRVYVTLRITNGAGLSSEARSQVVLIDDTPPPAPVVSDQGAVINIAQKPTANWIWSDDDPESGIESYEWTVVRSEGELATATWYADTGSRNADTASVTDLSLWPPAQGDTWYFAVRATNHAGLTSIGLSNGITFDGTAPYIAAVKLLQGLSSGDTHYVSSLTDLKLLVSAYEDIAQSGIDSYGATYGNYDTEGNFVQAPGAADYASGESVIDLSNPQPAIADGSVAIFRGECKNGADLVEHGYSAGTLFDTGIPIVEKLRGLATTGGLIFDWKVSNSDSPVSNYILALYEDGNPAPVWNGETSESLISFDFDTLSLPDGLYTLGVVAINKCGVSSAETKSVPVIMDRTPPVLSESEFLYPRYIYNILPYHLTAGEDTYSGIAEYQYTLGTQENPSSYTGGWVTLSVASRELARAILLEELPCGIEGIPHGSPIILSIRAKNLSLLWSEPLVSEPIIVDKTMAALSAPSGPRYTSSDSTITGVSFKAQDYESGLIAYRLAITGSASPDDTPLSEWLIVPVEGMGPGAGETTFAAPALTGLALEHNVSYYVAIEALNGAGVWSPRIYTDAIICDIHPPQIEFPLAGTQIVVNDFPHEVPYIITEDASDTIDIDFALVCVRGSGQGTVTELPAVTKTAGSFTLGLPQLDYGTYDLTFTVRDSALNFAACDEPQNIRINEPPIVVLSPVFDTTPGAPCALQCEAVDPDGDEPVTFLWELVTQEGTRNETAQNTVYTYLHIDPHNPLTSYPALLYVTDNAGKSTSASSVVEVRNTSRGTLYVDEYWSGTHEMTGNVTVPEGKTLHFMAGTQVAVTGNPIDGADFRLTVAGTLDATGGGSIILSPGPYDSWNGIFVTGTANIGSLAVSGAKRGLTATPESNVTITGCRFEGNRTGVHAVGSNPLITGTTFASNSRYGIKEDGGGRPQVRDCTFTGNLTDYYDETETSITMEELNTKPGNAGNGRESQ